jgi:hypothetical protein
LGQNATDAAEPQRAAGDDVVDGWIELHLSLENDALGCSLPANSDDPRIGGAKSEALKELGEVVKTTASSPAGPLLSPLSTYIVTIYCTAHIIFSLH